jgi:transcription antitermination factor NusA-like protein
MKRKQELQETQASFFVKLCSDKAAYEARLKRQISFNLLHVKQLFEATGDYQILVDTPHILILKNLRGNEVTFSKDGRIIIKKVADKIEAEKIAQAIFQIALKASSS